MTPKDDYWDEILQQIDMDYIPLEYINTVIVTFQDGKQWEIDIEKSSNNIEDTENILDNFFKEYEDTIDTVDFRLNIDQLKNDINKRTKRFLKVNK